jgi:hypothetical protein
MEKNHTKQSNSRLPINRLGLRPETKRYVFEYFDLGLAAFVAQPTKPVMYVLDIQTDCGSNKRPFPFSSP